MGPPPKTLYPNEPGELVLYLKRLGADQAEARKKLDNILLVLKKWAPKGLAAACEDLEFVQSVNLLHLMANRVLLGKQDEGPMKFARDYAAKKDFFTPLLALYSLTDPVSGGFEKPFSLVSDMNGKIFDFLYDLVQEPRMLERAKSSADPKLMELYATTLEGPARAELFQFVFWHYDTRQYALAASAERFNRYPFGTRDQTSLKQNFPLVWARVASEPKWVYTALATDCFSYIDGSFYATALEQMIKSYEKDDFTALSKLAAMMLETDFTPQGDWTGMISGIPKAVSLVFNSNARLFVKLVSALSGEDKKKGLENVINILVDESDERMWKLGMAILTQCIRYEESHYGGNPLVQSQLFGDVMPRARAKLAKKGKLEWVKTLLKNNLQDPQTGPGAKALLGGLGS